MKPLLSAFVVAVAWLAPLLAAQGAERFAIGHDGCVAIEQEPGAGIGDQLIALVAGQPPGLITVDRVQRLTGEPPATRGGRGSECEAMLSEHLFRDGAGTTPAAVARVSGAHASAGAFFAVPSTGLLTLGGVREALPAADRTRLVELVRPSLPYEWPLERLLVRADRYGPHDGHDIVELHVGLPTLNTGGGFPPIARISIRRIFIVDGRPAAAEAYERVSGVEERADTDPPQLTFDNWADSDTEHTAGFISRNNGATWERLTTDEGFEGINWTVQALRDGAPRVFHRYLYTPH